MFAFTIAPHREERQRRLGVVARFAKPPSSDDASRAVGAEHAGASFLMSSASASVAPFTALRPVTANWLA